ncbi:MAG: hypothetical protein AAF928_07325 [Myxococcota bacterium]
MNFRRLLPLSTVALLPLVGVANGCSTTDAPETATPSNVTEVNHTLRGRWAVDMAKVDQHYGTSSEYFLGVTSGEAGLAEVSGMMQQNGLPALTTVWDQTAKRLPDGSKVEETGTEYAVIDRDGNRIDPEGYVNIIPMLRETEPSKQVHIKEYLNNGDVIVYFHPEQTGTRGAMERRQSHVGMHYELTNGDQELVHHIDNPNSYGPVYNHAPNRQMPFHVFRFKPRAGDLIGGGGTIPSSEVVASPEGVAYTQAQVDAVLTAVNQGSIATADDRNALHRVLDIDLALRADAAGHIVQYRYHNGPIQSLDVLAAIPRVGPAALSTLRDNVEVEGSAPAGVPMTAAQARAYGEHAADWAMINNDLSPFASFFELNLQRLDQLDAFSTAAINGNEMPGLYCSGLAYANLNLAINRPLNPTGLEGLYDTFAASSYYFSDAGREVAAAELADETGLTRLNRLAFEPYGPTDIMDAWIENYWFDVPLPVKQVVFQTPGFQQQIVQGFGQLEWSDDQADAKQSAGEFQPATIENVARWAKAYGLGADATDAYLAADADLAEKFSQLGISREGMTPMDIVKAVEGAFIENKFVPPQIWMDEADKDDASLVYVGTVLNCEILSSVDGTGDDACAGSGGGVSEFSEGAADTSTYPDYAVTDGSAIMHRRFDVAGPEHFGPDSTVTVRVTHPEVSDVRFILHVPQTWEGHQMATAPYQEFRVWCDQHRADGGTCAAETGILLDPASLGATAGSVDDATYTWRLGDICTFSDDGTEATCPMATSIDGFRTQGDVTLSTWANGGRIAATMVDVGENATSLELPNCSACTEGGGHYNQYKVRLVASEETSTGGGQEPGGEEPGGDASEWTPGSCNDVAECSETAQTEAGCYCDSLCADNAGSEDDLRAAECCSDYVAVCGG